MKQSNIVQAVEGLIRPVVEDLSLELVDVEYKREGRNWVLRVFLDKEAGITVDDCTQVSRQIGDLIEIDELITNPYVLEVSSPGLDRPLKKESDFLKFKNRRIRLSTCSPINKRRNFKGTIQEFKDGTLFLDAQGTLFEIALSNIAKANLEIEL